MSDRIQEHFGLSRRPFDKEIPSELMWMDGGRQQARADGDGDPTARGAGVERDLHGLREGEGCEPARHSGVGAKNSPRSQT